MSASVFSSSMCLFPFLKLTTLFYLCCLKAVFISMYNLAKLIVWGCAVNLKILWGKAIVWLCSPAVGSAGYAVPAGQKPLVLLHSTADCLVRHEGHERSMTDFSGQNQASTEEAGSATPRAVSSSLVELCSSSLSPPQSGASSRASHLR